MTDPTTLPGGRKHLRFKTLAERQRYEAILLEGRTRFDREGLPNLTDAEVLLAVLNDHEARAEETPCKESRP